MKWLSRIFCFLGIHDWREMNGYCRECGKPDVFQLGSNQEETDESDN